LSFGGITFKSKLIFIGKGLFCSMQLQHLDYTWQGTPHYLAFSRDIHAEEAPELLFLSGFKSDMTGSKASFLAEFCAQSGINFTRFDYFGHGQSSGDFTNGTIGLWRQNLLHVMDMIGKPVWLVGSSMGGWLMLLGALARPVQVRGMVGIAAAPDFTEDLLFQAFTPAQKTTLHEQGQVVIENCQPGEEPYSITRQLIEEARTHCLMGQDSLAIDCPVHLLHGMQDADVLWQTSPRLAEKLTSHQVQISLLKSGDHRMSSPEALALLAGAVEAMIVNPILNPAAGHAP
jgi:pimeloyl-ACP methyl ester carboxylesterase